MQNQPTTPNDEINLFDLWQILVLRKWWVLITTFLAMVAAVVAVILIKPQWEATATIRIGVVGQVGQSGKIIEPIARVVARMQLRPFEDAVLANLAPSERNKSETALYRDSIEVNGLPDPDLIEIKVRGYSRESAERYTEATVNHLSKLHEEMAASTRERMTQLLTRTKREIAQTEAEREKMHKLTDLKEKILDDAHYLENIMLANIMTIQQDRELRALEQTKTEYEEQLGPLRTYPTSLIERISVSEKPVAPNKPLIIFLAGVLGLFLGIIAAFLSNNAQARK
jgi:hypothetical protein